MNRDPFGIGEIYHIYNRGTDKRKIFLDVPDYLRFVKDLYYFNDEHPMAVSDQKDFSNLEVRPRDVREKTVEILAFCLMPNHYHLLIQEIKDGGIIQFMKKLGTGYTMYFNAKSQRNGVLFQGRFKSVRIDKDSYLRYIVHYIHANPLDKTMAWRDGVTDVDKALAFLDGHRWSSYQYYANKKTQLLLDGKVLKDLFSGGRYRANFQEWLRTFRLDKIKDLVLE